MRLDPRPYIPKTVEEKATQFWNHPLADLNRDATWQWGGDDGQWEIELCDMNTHHIDPSGYAALRPLEYGNYALIFVIDREWPEGFDPGNLVFPSIEQAKHCLDTLLAADTPEIPIGA